RAAIRKKPSSPRKRGSMDFGVKTLDPRFRGDDDRRGCSSASTIAEKPFVEGSAIAKAPGFAGRDLLHDESDPHVDPPLGDVAVAVGDGLDLVDPGTLDALHGLGGLLQS